MLDWYSGKRIFLTGHTGFKGTWLSRILLKAGAEVTGYALPPPTNPSVFEMTKTGENIRGIYGDVRDGRLMQKAMNDAKPDVVFHLAAQPIVRTSYNDPVATYETNVMGTVNVLEAVRHCPAVKSVVIITTDKVYKNKEWQWGYRENEELCGYDPYSNSKSCSELVAYSYRASFFGAQGSPAISTARSGNVIGGGDRAKDRIIPDCVRAASAGEVITLRNPNSTRPYQHVLECLNGYLTLAQKQCEDNALSSSYNFGPDEKSCITTGALAQLFCKEWGKGARWETVGEQNAVHEANFLKLDCSKSRHTLMWQPKWDICTAIQKTVEWEKKVLSGESAAKITDAQITEYFEDKEPKL